MKEGIISIWVTEGLSIRPRCSNPNDNFTFTFIQTQNTSNRNEWWDESCKLIMSQKNEAQKKYLQAKTRVTPEI
jgi:hypothetical protein